MAIETLLGASVGAGPTLLNWRLGASTASTNAFQAKTTKTRLLFVVCRNNTAAALYLKLYNKGASAPVVGTDTPRITLPLAPGNNVFEFEPFGLDFSVGLGTGITTGAADTDTTAVAAGDVTALSLVHL